MPISAMKGPTGDSWVSSPCVLRSDESLAHCLTSFQELMDHGEVSWDFLTHGFIKNVSETCHDYFARYDYGGSYLPLCWFAMRVSHVILQIVQKKWANFHNVSSLSMSLRNIYWKKQNILSSLKGDCGMCMVYWLVQRALDLTFFKPLRSDC